MKLVLKYRLEETAIQQAAEIAAKLSEIAGVKVEPGAAVERAIKELHLKLFPPTKK